MIQPMIAMPGGGELILIVLIIVLLFGAKKLPELARGTGRALRIFKAETTGLMDNDDDQDDKDVKEGPARPTGELGATAKPAVTDPLKSEHRPDTTN